MRRAALEAARTYEREAFDRIRRMNVVGAELELRGGGNRRGGLNTQMSGLTDVWYDEPRKPVPLGQSQEI